MPNKTALIEVNGFLLKICHPTFSTYECVEPFKVNPYNQPEVELKKFEDYLNRVEKRRIGSIFVAEIDGNCGRCGNCEKCENSTEWSNELTKNLGICAKNRTVEVDLDSTNLSITSVTFENSGMAHQEIHESACRVPGTEKTYIAFEFIAHLKRKIAYLKRKNANNNLRD